MKLIVGGTGHRPPKLGGYTDEVFDKLVGFARSRLLEHFVCDDLTVISGLALGWDQAIAVAAHDIGATVWGYAPCRNQDSKWPQWSKDKHAEVLAILDKLVYIHDGDYPGGYCMIDRDKAMVNDSQVMLALWDGSMGGTGKTVEYARKVNRAVINVWDEWLLVS